MMKKKILLFVAFAMLTVCAYADSPLTSCTFHKRYSAVAMVSTAARTNTLSQAMMNYLATAETPSHREWQWSTPWDGI